MNPKPSYLQWILRPLSWIYGSIVYTRNYLFDKGLLPSQSYPMPVICIGNLSVGGTGKTPHTEYLIRLLHKHKTAVLSRGYKRKSKGFLEANKQTQAHEIGDEPYQMLRKFPHIRLAVDGNRRRGITQLSRKNMDLDLILLNDAYQHRYVKASLNILLTDYNRPIYCDRMLPSGRLRENISGKKRADIVIVTKTPSEIDQAQKTEITQKLALLPTQKLYFSTIRYAHPEAIFANQPNPQLDLASVRPAIVLLTGIANPQSLLAHLGSFSPQIINHQYPDHHWFRLHDIEKAFAQLEQFTTQKSIVLCTEKDAVRIREMANIPERFKQKLYFIAIEIDFLSHKNEFDAQILAHIVSKKKQNSRLSPEEKE